MSLTIKRLDNESVENLIKRFNLSVKKSGILPESIRRMHYHKPSDLKRRKRLKTKKKIQKLRI